MGKSGGFLKYMFFMKNFTKTQGLFFHTLIILTSTEAATGGVLYEKVFLEISQNSQENTCARVSFLLKKRP